MKSVLISINPKWCELIASGRKTIEVRKSKPKCDVPFKVYIYCTKGVALTPCNDLSDVRNGKVIGEFICDFINNYTAEFVDDDCYESIHQTWKDFDGGEFSIVSSNEDEDPDNCYLCRSSCLSFKDIKKYVGLSFHDRPFYGWHISDLKIYDKPKELSEFFHDCGEKPNCERCRLYFFECNEDGAYDECCSPLPHFKPLDRPPRSWMYVEDK